MPRQFDAGNPTDYLPSRPIVKWQLSSVGLPSHPWVLFDVEVEVICGIF
jgi:hypothetical protein